MDAEDLQICACCLGYFFTSFAMYILYKVNAQCLKALKEAPRFEIDSKLKKEVAKNGGVIQYAVISGSIKALSDPIRSQYIPHLQGVIYEKVTREHKWIPFLCSWSSANNLKHIIKYVPFSLCGKTSLFKKQVCVEVIEPFFASALIVPTVYDKFTPYHDKISDAVVGFFCGERAKGLQEIERMVCEDMTFTAAGRLFIENNQLKIERPDDVVNYFVMPFTIESQINIVNFLTKLSKAGFIITSTITVSVFIYILRYVVLKYKIKKNKNQERKALVKLRKLRRMADKSRGRQDVNIPKCVICLVYPIEVLTLECGHACLCFDCSARFETCPVCRKPILRRVEAFWP